MSVLALLLADGRFPSGGHAHSGGLEEAVTSGRVVDLGSLEAFLRGRLATSGLVAAALAAAAGGGRFSPSELDAEADARMASPAVREASRRQGRQLLRAASALPLPSCSRFSPPGGELSRWGGEGSGPHHAVAIGLVVAAAGLSALDAARWATYAAVAGPATAGVRLLGLDPFGVHGRMAALADDMEAVAADGAAAAVGVGALADLPCGAAPLLDVGAERHATWEARLFAS